MSEVDRARWGGKWIGGLSPQMSVAKAGCTVLRSRLGVVCYWLEQAARVGRDDPESVHQLRVSSRRAVEALRLFSNAVPKRAATVLRGRLQRLRRAADEARNWDVLCGQFSCDRHDGEPAWALMAETITARREAAHRPIDAVYEELRAEDFNRQIAELIDGIRSSGRGKPPVTFARHGVRSMRSALKRFAAAAAADLSDAAAFHRLRIAAKKLRYTMEIVAAVFPPRFRKRLYRRVVRLQDAMGLVNDHATAESFFGGWLGETDDERQRAFLRGVVWAEQRAHADLLRAFETAWPRKKIEKLWKEIATCRGRGRKARRCGA